MYRFVICDVFTDRRFGGNPLAVVPDASGLDDTSMQQIAREFGFSETTFVLPAESGQTRRVRIFTPAAEIPFAGHPNLGTAWVLARDGLLGDLTETQHIVFEEAAGLVPIEVGVAGGKPARCELAAPQPLHVGDEVPAERAAAAAGLTPEDIATKVHPPQVVSIGLPFLIVALETRDALERARPDARVLEAFGAEGLPGDLHLYTVSNDDFDLRTRMFAPLGGIPEDPATGSANCTLGALLAHCDPTRDGTWRWKIAQGVEMGRPSTLYATAVKRDGAVTEARIAGDSVFVAEGRIDA